MTRSFPALVGSLCHELSGEPGGLRGQCSKGGQGLGQAAGALARETHCTQLVTWTPKCLIPACKRQTGPWWRSTGRTLPWVPSNRLPLTSSSCTQQAKLSPSPLLRWCV
uniref:Uncharacterized protein n=1 Tax=Rhinolophus ferrumequinum TaxID=59479 RepID=A0A671DTB8_RHIFE